tara:strand:+ start:10 stop:273 length:264 start_codon:yes stop_codon:yes gene_type:complete
MKVVPDWKEMNSVLRVVITSVFTGFLAVLIFIACNDEYYLGKSREELYREMFEVDSLMKTIQLQIDSTSMELSSFYLNAQRINNGHE